MAFPLVTESDRAHCICLDFVLLNVNFCTGLWIETCTVVTAECTLLWRVFNDLPILQKIYGENLTNIMEISCALRAFILW